MIQKLWRAHGNLFHPKDLTNFYKKWVRDLRRILFVIYFIHSLFVWIKGVNFIFRQFAKLAKPTWIITTNDNVYWTIEQTGGREQPPVTFKDREEFTRRSNLCLINFYQRLNLKLILYLVNQKHKMAI
jgi:hypothetical protein